MIIDPERSALLVLDAEQMFMRLMRAHEPRYDAVVAVFNKDLGRYILEHQYPNRPLALRSAENYGRDMTAGEWDLNGEPLIFSQGAQLLDGQTRLRGCIDADTEFASIVIFGVEDTTFRSMGSGKKRSPGDKLGQQGEKSPTKLAAALRFLWRVENREFSAARMIPDRVLDRYLEQHEGMREALRWGSQARKTVPHSVGSALFYLFSCVDAPKARDFFYQLSTGAHLDTRDTIYRLRSLLDSTRGKTVGRGAGANQKIAAEIILAWNGYRAGRRLTVNQMAWQLLNDQGEPQPFPDII